MTENKAECMKQYLFFEARPKPEPDTKFIIVMVYYWSGISDY